MCIGHLNLEGFKLTESTARNNERMEKMKPTGKKAKDQFELIADDFR